MKGADTMNATDTQASAVMDPARRTNARLDGWKTSVVEGRRLAKTMAKCLKPFDLTIDEWLIMDTIAGHGGITMSGLAQDTVLPAATLSRLVDRLVDEALLYRKANPFDRRQIQVYVSQRGMRLMEKIAEDLNE